MASSTRTSGNSTTMVEGPVREQGHWIDRWEPEEEGFWRSGGKRVAIRNLIFSVFAEHLGFSVWLLWSTTVVFLGKAGFHFSVDQLFWLVSIPALVGATVRIPYAMAVAKFGGRNWTVVSALLLLVPVVGLIVCVKNPNTPYSVMLLIAALAGLGGGNFASSMANISYFFPARAKGLALGINAAGGNVGAATVQLLIPLVVVGTAGSIAIGNAGLIWIIPILVASVCAFLFMDNLRVSGASAREQFAIVKYRDTWFMSLIYIGTFGSFMGYTAAFPLLLHTQFPAFGIAWAFLGALVGSLFRPVGGAMADKLGGAHVTMASFAVMGCGAVAVLYALSIHSLPVFFGAFLVLFAVSGIGNGSSYRMIPPLFALHAQRRAARTGGDSEVAKVTGQREAAAVIGLTAAIGAFGGFLIPRGIATSIGHTHSVGFAVYVFLGFYILCLGVTWARYVRKSSPVLVGVRSAESRI